MPLQQFSIWFIFSHAAVSKAKRFDKFYVPYYYWEFLPEFLFYVLKSCFFYSNVFTLCPYYISKVKYFPIKAKKGENCKEESFNSFILQLFLLPMPIPVYQTHTKKNFKKNFLKNFLVWGIFWHYKILCAQTILKSHPLKWHFIQHSKTIST